MIQRIQSLYLLLTGLLVTMLLFLPFAGVSLSNGQILIFNSSGVYSITAGKSEFMYSTSLPGFLIGFSGIISLISIFIFKNRKRQLMLIVINIISVLCIEGILWLDKIRISRTFSASFNFKFPVIFPVIAFVLLILAFRAVKKDEELIRSADRLR